MYVEFVRNSGTHSCEAREECEEQLVEEMVKQELNSIEIASAIFNEAMISEHKANLPELTEDMQVNWNISLCLYI